MSPICRHCIENPAKQYRFARWCSPGGNPIATQFEALWLIMKHLTKIYFPS